MSKRIDEVRAKLREGVEAAKKAGAKFVTGTWGDCESECCLLASLHFVEPLSEGELTGPQVRKRLMLRDMEMGAVLRGFDGDGNIEFDNEDAEETLEPFYELGIEFRKELLGGRDGAQ